LKVCTTCGAEWSDDTRFCPSDGSPLRPTGGAENLIGSVMAGRYHIVSKLGEGGMGAVYLGEHVKMGRKSAIKVLTRGLAQDHEAIARFNREAANAARINHPNVCAIYDFGESDEGLIYLAMEFIEGETLTALLDREGPLGPYRAATITRQTADALQSAHDLGIVHRDLKPDNIMISRGRDGSDLVKVVDFGIAKATGGEQGQKVTRTGLVVGTPEYMSPEQLSGDHLDGRSDIYSLALVLFRMLTGKLPFQAGSAQEVMIKRLTDTPLALNDALPGGNFPQRLQAVINHALQRMPGDRCASAEAFARDVLLAVTGAEAAQLVDTQQATQILSTAPTTPDVTEQLKPTRVSAASKQTIPVEQAAKPASTPDTPMPMATPTRRTRRKRPMVAIAASAAVVAIAGGSAALLVLKGGGPQQAGTEDTPAQGVPTVPGVVDSQTLAARNERQANPTETGGQQPIPANPTPSGGEQGTVPTAPVSLVDSAAIDRELVQMFEIVDTLTSRASLMADAQARYDDPRVPANLRADAAGIVARGHWLDGDQPQACLWVERAITLQPDRYFQELKGNWGCRP